jgi:hypothetical protein
MFDNPQTAYTRELVEAVPHIETGVVAIAIGPEGVAPVAHASQSAWDSTVPTTPQ